MTNRGNELAYDEWHASRRERNLPAGITYFVRHQMAERFAQWLREGSAAERVREAQERYR